MTSCPLFKFPYVFLAVEPGDGKDTDVNATDAKDKVELGRAAAFESRRFPHNKAESGAAGSGTLLPLPRARSVGKKGEMRLRTLSENS